MQTGLTANQWIHFYLMGCSCCQTWDNVIHSWFFLLDFKSHSRIWQGPCSVYFPRKFIHGHRTKPLVSGLFFLSAKFLLSQYRKEIVRMLFPVATVASGHISFVYILKPQHSLASGLEFVAELLSTVPLTSLGKP